MRIFFLFCLGIVLSTSAIAQKGLKTIMAEHQFSSTDGQQKSLADIIEAHKGKVIYIDFWASWCGPCKRAMPASKKLHNKLAKEDIVFIYLSLDDNADAWKKSLIKLGFVEKKYDDNGGSEEQGSNTLNTVSSHGIREHWRRGRKEATELMKFFYIYSIPHYMIIGKDGQIVNRDALPPSDPRIARQLRKWLN